MVATLSQCLDLDAGVLIPELRQTEEVRYRSAPPATDEEPQAVGELAEEEMAEEEDAPKKRRNGKAAPVDNDFSDLLPVSSIFAHYMSHPGLCRCQNQAEDPLTLICDYSVKFSIYSQICIH